MQLGKLSLIWQTTPNSSNEGLISYFVPRDDPVVWCIHFFCMILNGPGSYVVHFTILICFTVPTEGINHHHIDVSTFHLPHNVVGSNMFKRKGSLCKTQHEKEKYWYTVLKNDKNVNHFKVEKEMHLNICIYNKKKFFFLFGEERCRKGHCIS